MEKQKKTDKENFSNNILEVEVIIPEEVIKSESSLKEKYLKGKLTYNLGDEVPENVKQKITDIILTSKTEEIVQFNPLIMALETLQGFKLLKYDPEAKNDRDYIDSNKIIGSTNTAIKSVTDLMKKDATDYIKNVNEIKNFFLTEAQTTREILQENFKPYLDEQAAAKQAKEDKKNAEILEANKKLTQANEEQALKLKNQQKETAILTIDGEIGKIAFSATSGVSVLNLDGLERLKKETDGKSLDKIISDKTLFTEEEIAGFQTKFDDTVATSIKAIDVAISNINATEENKTLQSTVDVMQAKQPETILTEDNSNNGFVPPVSLDDADSNDVARLAELVEFLTDFNKCIQAYKGDIKNIKFEDPGLVKIQKIITDSSFPKIEEWSEKLATWTADKRQAYLNHLIK